MMRPGAIFIHTEVRLDARFFDDDDVDADPDTVTLMSLSPSGNQATYTYGTDSNIGRTNPGDYYCDITPDESGEWFWRWTATGNGTTVASEGKFQVQHSPHYDGARTRY